MAGKPQKSWSEIQMAIAAISVTATLSFWNVFAASDQQQAVQKAQQTNPPPPPTPIPTETAAPEPEPTAISISLVPVKIIFSGQAPKQQIVQVVAPQAKKKNNNNNNGDTGSAPAPAAPAAPVTSTGSSK